MTWKIVRPGAATNWILNPSAETTGNFAVAVGGAVTRVLGAGCYGDYGYQIVPAGVDRGIQLTAATPASPTQIYFAARGVTGTLTVAATATETAVPVQNLGGGWVLYQAVDVGFAGTTVRILNSVNETWYIDGVVYCATGELQTYIDGDQAGCSWLGIPHASASYRPATVRAGGEILDFEDDLYFRIVNTPGDTTSVVNIISGRPFRAGGSNDMTMITPRVMILLGWLTAATLPMLHTRWTGIDDILRPDAVPLAADGRPQPVTLQYWGAERVLQLRAHYRQGLEQHQNEGDGFKIKVPLQFDVTDPYWTEAIETAHEVDTSETMTAHLVFGRQGGEWTDMGPPAGGSTGGLLSDALETGQYVYIGGHTVLNADADQAYLARYNKLAGTWAGIGTPNGTVYRIIQGPDGAIYVCGVFTTVDGGAVAALRIARYDPVADTWQAIGNTFNAGSVWDIIFDPSGNLYAAWGGSVYVTSDPTNPAAVWTQLGGAVTGITTVYALEVLPFVSPPGSSYIFAGGSGGSRFARCLSSGVGGWSAIPGIDGDIYALKMAKTNWTLYLGGTFTEAVASYRVSTGIIPIPGPPSGGAVITLDYDPDTDTLYVGGGFTAVGGSFLGVTAARYHPAANRWAPIQFSTDPGPPTIRISRIRVGQSAPGILGDPPQPRNLWFLYYNTMNPGALDVDLTYPATETIVTANVPGGAASKPIIALTADDYAVVNSIVNRTTGAEIILDFEIAYGDTIYIDLVDLRCWSERLGYPIHPKPGSRFASWSLLPTGNIIDIRVNTDAATVTGTLRYAQRYHSYRSADVP